MGKNRLGVVLAADGEKDFIRTFTNVNKSLAVTRSESAKVSAEFEGQKNTIAALTAKHEVLNRRLAEQKEKQEAAARGLEHANSNYDSAKKRLKELEEALEDARKKQESMGISSDELKAQMEDQAKEITALSRKLKDAKAVYDEMKASGSASANEMKAQKNSIKSLSDELGKMKDRQKELKGMASPVDEYTIAVERQKSEIARCENKIKDWQKKVNTAETELINANRALNENAAYMKEAEEAADGCATSIDKFGKSVAQSAVSLSVKDGFLAGIGSNLADAGLDLLKDGLEAVKDTMYDTSSASAKLAASTGLSEAAARKYQSVMQQIKGDNFGESYEDVSAAMAEVIQIMGELNETDMRDATESAIALRDTFEMDVNESIRAADVMMKTMHVDAATAFDLITKGAQNGLNRSGELVDNITEYGQLWGQAGFSAEQMFAILENGLDAGAYNLDKVNDYVKEFGNSLADGRIEENLSSFSEKTQGLFEEWKNGNASTSDVFYSVIDDLSQMTNQQEALTLASEVWSALGEDNAMQVLTALDDVNDKYKDVKGSMDALKEVRYSDLESAISGLGGAVQENIVTPIANVATPVLTNVINLAADAVNGIGEAISPAKTELEEFSDSINEANDQLAASIENRNNTVANAELEAGQLEALGSRLVSLMSVEQKSAAQKAEMEQIIGRLSQSIPGLAGAYDAETGALKLTTDQIQQYIKAQKESVITQATLAANQELINSLVEAQTKYDEVTKKVQELENQDQVYTSQIEEVNRLSDALAAGTISQEEYEQGLLGIAMQYEDLMATGQMSTSMIGRDLYILQTKNQEALESLKKDQEEYKETIDEGTEAVKQRQESAEELAKALSEENETVKESSSATDANAAKQEQLAARKQEAAAASEQEAEAIERTTEALTAEEKAAKASADAQKDAYRSVLEAYESTVQSIESDLQNKINPFDKFDGGEDMTVEDMLANLQSQTEGLEKYKENLKTITEEMGGEIAPEFLSYIESMGTDGANMLQHMVDTLDQENGKDLIREMSEEYVKQLDMTEGIAKAQAANEMALQAMIGDVGSSDLDFSMLKDSIEEAAESAAEGWAGLQDATKSKLDEAVRVAQECGAEIPQGLADGITSGETSPEEAIAALNGALEGRFDGLAAIAKEQGLQVPEELQAGIDAGGQSAIDAYNKLIQMLSDAAASAGEAGRQTGQSVTDEAQAGIESGTEKVTGASSQMAQAAADASTEASGEFETSGQSAAASYASGITAKQQSAVSAAATMARNALNAAKMYQQSFQSAGSNMAAGVAAGIRSGESAAISAAAAMARMTLAAAKRELEIQSPSKKFRREVGQQIGVGAAMGISDKASLAGNAAAQMSGLVYDRASEWLAKYKQKQKTSVGDEQWYWQQMLLHVKEGTEAYNNATARMIAAGVSEYTTTGSGKKKKTTKKDAETYYSEIYQAAEKYQSRQAALNDMSIKEELSYWTAIKAQLKSGTEAWYSAQSKISSLQTKVGTVGGMSSILSAYQTYYDMSEKAEMDYWDTVRKQYAAGTDERLEADEKYLDAREKYTDKLKDLEDDYLDKVKDVDDKLADKLEDLTKKYKNELESRTKAIKDSFGLFDEFESESADGKTLLFNIKAQAAGYEDWAGQLAELSGKGILNEDLLEELKEQGPEISASIHALNSLSRDELAEYNEAYLRKLELSRDQATKDTESLRLEVQQQETALREQAARDKTELLTEYQKNIASVNTTISSQLLTLAESARSIAEDQTTALVAAITGQQAKAGVGDSVGVSSAPASSASASAAPVAAPAQVAAPAAETSDKILEIINSGAAKKSMSASERKKHTDLYIHIYDRYKRAASNDMYKQLAKELGVKASSTVKSKEKDKILKALKKKGYRSGGRSLKEQLAWMDEELDSKGPEMIVRKSDNAVLTRIKPGDDIIDADTVSNLTKWGKYTPGSYRAALAEMQAQIARQQDAMRDAAEQFDAGAGIRRLNRLLDTGASASQTRQTAGNADKLETMMGQMVDLMSEFLPYLPYLSQRQQVVLDTGKVVSGTEEKMSKAFAMRKRRRR